MYDLKSKYILIVKLNFIKFFIIYFGLKCYIKFYFKDVNLVKVDIYRFNSKG